MAHLTNNFTSEAPLSPAVREAISAALEQGWADPKKQSQASSRTAILRDAALSEIASHFGTSPERLEVTGEPSLLHFIALMGFMREESTLYSSTVDLGKIRAIGRQYCLPENEIGVDENGLYILGNLKVSKNSVVSIQATNGETGVTQDLERWRNQSAHVVLDATHSSPQPNLVEGFAATTLDAASWAGPSGLGFLAIGAEKSFKYPLPHLAPIRVPGSYSIPLLVGSAIALNEFSEHRESLIHLRGFLVEKISSLQGVTVLAAHSGAQSRYLSIIVEGISSEEILRALLKANIAVDAGSACSPEDLTPSHVIAAMGFPTPGHLRFTIHPGHTESDISALVSTLGEVLTELSS
ncbi:NifS Cysteine sulfinate desulfinase/cysteine desulfurase and related enzymes [Candidatus Nanopelagicaceae bacterium]